jgi:hypothetical protein
MRCAAYAKYAADILYKGAHERISRGTAEQYAESARSLPAAWKMQSHLRITIAATSGRPQDLGLWSMTAGRGRAVRVAC